MRLAGHRAHEPRERRQGAEERVQNERGGAEAVLVRKCLIEGAVAALYARGIGDARAHGLLDRRRVVP